MSYLLLLFLAILLIAVGFFVYFFYYARTKYTSKDLSAASHGGARDLQEMVRLLERGGADNAHLVIEQLASRKLQGRDAPDVLALRLRAFFKMKEYRNALHCALQLIQQKDRSRFITEVGLIEHFAEIYAALEHHDRAYNEYVLLSQKQPQNYKYLYGAAIQALELRQYETSVNLFEKVLQLQPQHAPSLAKMGRIYYKKNLYSQALDFLKRSYAQNYDSNELRYYLALTLMQTSGQDRTALSLLQRVAKDPDWSKQTLPQLAKLADKMGVYLTVIEAINKFRALHSGEMNEHLPTEVLMLEANAYRRVHNIEQACVLWQGIDEESAYYDAAQDNLLLFQYFTTPGVFQDYLKKGPSEFTNLCSKLCRFLEKSRNNKAPYTISGKSLQQHPSSKEDQTIAQALPGALLLQRFQAHWDPTTSRQGSSPRLHIFLRLDQEFDDNDLYLSLQSMDLDRELNNVIDIHIYALHHVSSASFMHSISYNIHIHTSADFRQMLANFQQEQAANPENQGTPKKKRGSTVHKARSTKVPSPTSLNPKKETVARSSPKPAANN